MRVLCLATFGSALCARHAVPRLLASLASRVAAPAPPCLVHRSWHAMASTSSQHETTRAPPPPDQLASFHSVVDKYVVAGGLSRFSRAAELSAQAADNGEALFGNRSLVVAHLRMGESTALASLAIRSCEKEHEALLRRSFRALLSVIALLQRRLADDTLLPGTVCKDETEYHANLGQPVCTIGYDVLLNALYRSLNYLQTFLHPLWPDAQRKIVESFVRALVFYPPLLPLMRALRTPFPSGVPSPRCHPSHSQFA